MKKLLALFLSLTLALSLAVPAFALEDPVPDTIAEEGDVYIPTDYEQGQETGFDQSYPKGYEQGLADGKLGQPNIPAYESTEGDTFDDGYADGCSLGLYIGYCDGYQEASGRDAETDAQLLAKGGVPGQVNVMFDGRCVAFPDTAPKIVNARTMIPVRAVMENLGQQVAWDPDTRTVTITSPVVEQVIYLTIGSTTATVTRGEFDKETYTLDAPAYIDGGRTMVPLRFLSETCGYTVLWDKDFRTAVVVDDDALLAEIDSKFTHLNDLLASQMQSQAGKKYQQVDTLSGKVTLYDENGKAVPCPFSAAATSYTDGRSCKMELSFNLKEAITALVETFPELSEGLNVDLGTALRTDLSKIPATILLTADGKVYFQMPLLNKLMELENENTWLCLGSTGMDLSQPESLTIGQAVLAPLLTDSNAFYCQEALELSVAMLEAMFGDQAAKVSGSSVTWTLDGRSLAAAMGGELPEEAAALLDTFSMVMTKDKSGAYNITGSWKADLEGAALALDLKCKGDLTGGTGAFSCSIQDLFALELSTTTTIKTVITLPSLTLSAGAVVEDLGI